MRCGLPASSRQCGRCLGWSSTYADAADTSEPPNASPIPHHRSGFNRRAAYDIPCSVPALGTPMIRHGRPAKDEADLSSMRGAHEAREATALARPQTPRGPPVSVHRLGACRYGRVARAGGRIVEVKTPALAQVPATMALRTSIWLTPQVRALSAPTGRRRTVGVDPVAADVKAGAQSAGRALSLPARRCNDQHPRKMYFCLGRLGR